jgi:uncharacterized membrane protein
MNSLVKYATTAMLIAVLDLPWLLLSNTYASGMIRKIQGSELELRAFPAVIVYFALAYLALLPKTATEAFLLGLCVYAVYDFTNLATLAKYDWQFAIADSLWGGILFTIVYYALIYIKGL